MPLTVDEYKIGQLYMISKHSHEQSDRGEGVEVVQNEPFEDPHHGNGQFTEKRVYLNSKLPSWARAVVPKIFYVTEKAWNYYPYTITEYTCSFLPKFSIHIETKYEDNKGSNDSVSSQLSCRPLTPCSSQVSASEGHSSSPGPGLGPERGSGPLGPGLVYLIVLLMCVSFQWASLQRKGLP